MSWKLATFNVNGIRARLPLVLDWLAAQRPQVVCLQEIKCLDPDFPAGPFEELGYHVAVRGQKSFNGVAILSLEPPGEVLLSFADGRTDEEARFMAAAFGGIWVANAYVPMGRDPADPAFQGKLEFLARLKRWLEDRFEPAAPVVLTGDFNVAPAELDVFDPKRLDGQVGFHPAERQALSELISFGLVDLFRRFHPKARQFTFWDYRLPKGFERNLGWRLDHVLVTEKLARAALGCRVDTEPRGRPKPSDHTPVVAEFDLARL